MKKQFGDQRIKELLHFQYYSVRLIVALRVRVLMLQSLSAVLLLESTSEPVLPAQKPLVRALLLRPILVVVLSIQFVMILQPLYANVVVPHA